MARSNYVPGDWNAACAECGGARKASELIRHWQGYYVCPEHWEPRQAQDFVKAIPEKPTPPWVQQAADTFITSFCSTRDSTAGYAEAGCAIVGYVQPR